MPPLSDVVVVVALAGMLAVAFGASARPGRGVGRAVLCACRHAGDRAAHARTRSATRSTDLAPVVAFLVTILVVSDVCGRAGVFTAAAQRVGRWSGDSAALPVHRRLRARGRRHRDPEPRRDRRPADPGRARRGDGAVGPGRARDLRLPADGELRVAPAAGLEPDQPARPAPSRPDVHRVRPAHRSGARGRPRRRVRRPPPPVPRPAPDRPRTRHIPARRHAGVPGRRGPRDAGRASR